MLAFERMGSNPPHFHNPFGYQFGNELPSNLPLYGQDALLNDQESQFLNGVFDNPPDPLSVSDGSLLLPDNGSTSKLEQADFQWAFNELPPNFLGVHNLPTSTTPQTFPAPGLADGTTTAGPMNDVMAPSITDGLMPNAVSSFSPPHTHGHAHRHSLSAYPAAEAVMNFGGLHSPEALSSLRNAHPPAASHSMTPSSNSSSTTPHLPADQIDQPSIVGLWIHQSDSGSQSAPDSDIDAKRYYRFGSDGNFTGQRFLPASDRETDKSATDRIMGDWYRALIPDTSANNTEPPSPTNLRFARRAQSDGTARIDLSMNGVSDADSDDERPRKRQRSIYDGDAAMAPDAKSHTRSLSSQIRHKVRRISTASSGSPVNRGRKSSPTSASKAPREHLSEEQKRSNHILSEQKRRNLIKNGFEELHNMVPELRSGGFSKSNVLVEAVNYLEELVRGNEQLRLLTGEAS